jgi:uncharacterized RDD family membrane protein YckC
VEISEESLRERYRTLSTEELAELEAQGALTETAQGVLAGILSERSATERERAREEAQQACAAANEPAPLGDRFAAQFVDGLITLSIMLALFFAGGWLAPSRALAGFLILFGVVGGFGYLWLSDGLRGGQSLGKRLFRIAVVHAVTGKPCTFGQSLARNATLSLLGVVDLLPLIGRERRRVGDYLARTRVVKAAPP